MKLNQFEYEYHKGFDKPNLVELKYNLLKNKQKNIQNTVPSLDKSEYSSKVNFSFVKIANGTFPSSRRCVECTAVQISDIGPTIKFISTSAYFVPNPLIDEPKSLQRISALKYRANCFSKNRQIFRRRDR